LTNKDITQSLYNTVDKCTWCKEDAIQTLSHLFLMKY